MFCDICITKGNLNDFSRFENELERLKDFAGAFATLTSDYDGCESAEDLKKFIDELTDMVVDTIVKGESLYDLEFEPEEETKKDAQPKNIRVMDKFTWVPHQDQPKHPAIPTPHRKPELRKPLYMLDYDSGSDVWLKDLYFVNFSEEVLDFVSTGSAGFQTVGDDEVMPVGGPDHSYESVQPNEAVMVEQYHIMDDSDYMMSLTLNVKSPSRGVMEFSTMGKGSVDAGVVLWDTGEAGKSVSFQVHKEGD